MTDKVNFAPSARELYFTGSGQTPPVPTDQQISDAIHREIASHGFHVSQDAVMAAARSVRALFPSKGETPCS